MPTPRASGSRKSPKQRRGDSTASPGTDAESSSSLPPPLSEGDVGNVGVPPTASMREDRGKDGETGSKASPNGGGASVKQKNRKRSRQEVTAAPTNTTCAAGQRRPSESGGAEQVGQSAKLEEDHDDGAQRKPTHRAEGQPPIYNVDDEEDNTEKPSVTSIASTTPRPSSTATTTAAAAEDGGADPRGHTKGSPSLCPTDVLCPGDSELSRSIVPTENEKRQQQQQQASTSARRASTQLVVSSSMESPGPRVPGAQLTEGELQQQGGDQPASTQQPGAVSAPPSTATTIASVALLGPSSLNTATAQMKRKQMTLDCFQPPPPVEIALRKEIEEKNAKIDALQQKIASLETDVGHKLSLLQHVEKRQLELTTREVKYRESLSSVMQALAQTSRREARRKQHALHFELGHIITSASSGGAFGNAVPKELWVEGNRPREYLRDQQELAVRESVLDAEKTALEKRLAALRKQGGTTAAITESLLKCDEASNGPLAAITDEAIETEERLHAVRREVEACAQAKEMLRETAIALESEKKVFLKEIRRIAEEDASEFATRAAIGPDGRYVLIELLGKGGFSEVWKAYDLKDAQYVACKFHKVGRDMSPHQKQHYLRHAERELEIMRQLNHSRLTRLFDVFEPEGTNDTFVAVMEYCAGIDLDTFLKTHRSIKESDAKTIMYQIIAALRHMADASRPIIHYDLKPANILFEHASTLSLDIKITDFGLSKIMMNAQDAATNGKHSEGIELTSQGTGTYWYLPPECFDTSRTPTISGKVDVWAAGVIFYQMLFGRRPFAEGVSQRQIWQDKLISQLSLKPIDFPATLPRVSEEAKAVIMRCLTANAADRCDIFQLSADPYFRKLSRGGGGSSVAKVAAAVGRSSASLSAAATAHLVNHAVVATGLDGVAVAATPAHGTAAD